MRIVRWVLIACLLVLLLAGIQLASAHDIQQGDKCACPGCDDGAVNHAVLEKYEADWKAISCPMGEPEACPAICEAEVASCTAAGKCYARTPTFIDGANYPKSCALPSDCHVIYTGEVCNSCQCATAAVNHEGYEQYQADIEGIDCMPGASACDCAPQEAVIRRLDRS